MEKWRNMCFHNKVKKLFKYKILILITKTRKVCVRLYFMHFLCPSYFPLPQKFHVIPAVYQTCSDTGSSSTASLPTKWSTAGYKALWHFPVMALPGSLINAKHSWRSSWWQWWESKNGKTGDIVLLAWRRGRYQSFDNRGARGRWMEAAAVGMKEPLLHVTTSASRTH